MAAQPENHPHLAKRSKMIAKYLLDQICFISSFGSQRISSLFSTLYFYHSSGCQRCYFKPSLLVLIATSIF